MINLLVVLNGNGSIELRSNHKEMVGSVKLLCLGNYDHVMGALIERQMKEEAIKEFPCKLEIRSFK